MRCILGALRAIGLAAAVLVLPCCRDQVGEGDQPAQITVRASLNLAKLEPTADCFEPYLSANGRWLVFASYSNVITPNDNNTIRDIFLKDRTTGEIFNLTYIPVLGFTPKILPGDCFDPLVSEDGNTVFFRSKGGWDSPNSPATALVNDGIFRLDRISGSFQRCWGGPDPNAPLIQPTISADGQVLAFASSATNIDPPTAGGISQIYVVDFRNFTIRIASRAQSPAAQDAPCNDTCAGPRLSADGNFVTFVSYATNLSPLMAGVETPQVYRGTSAGDYVVPVALGTDGLSFLPNISGDGRYVIFQSIDPQLVNPPAKGLMRKDLVTGEVVLVTNNPAGQPIPASPTGYISSISADGRMVAFMARNDSVFAPFNDFAQVYVKDMVTGTVLFCSRHKDGTPSNLDCTPPQLSADGKWVVWSTKGSTLVDGDTNGFADIFLRGPLR